MDVGNVVEALAFGGLVVVGIVLAERLKPVPKPSDEDRAGEAPW